ncbi:MAG: hypothetical protein NVS9B10_27650 [Nevskia sp.]
MNSNLVSSAVLKLNGLLFFVLGVRVLSAPGGFADELGLVSATPRAIEALVSVHAASFLAIAAAALAASFTPVIARGLLLALLNALGLLAWFWLWSLDGDYATLLTAALGINLVVLLTGFLGEPLPRGGDDPADGGEHSDHMRWG